MATNGDDYSMSVPKLAPGVLEVCTASNSNQSQAVGYERVVGPTPTLSTNVVGITVDGFFEVFSVVVSYQ